MALYKVYRYEAIRRYPVVLFAKPASSNNCNFSRSTVHRQYRTSNRKPWYSNFPGGLNNPLGRKDKVALKLRFVNQTKHLMYEIKHFYQNFIGNGEVQESQSKVNALQHKLSVLTEKRSSCEFELIDVKKQLAELNSSQQLVSREDAQYVELLWQEFKLNSEKQRLDSLLEVINNEHHMVLMQLTHAFNDVHAKERQEDNKLRLVKLFFTTLVAALRFLFFWWS